MLERDRHRTDGEPEAVLTGGLVPRVQTEAAQEGVPVVESQLGQQIGGRHVARVRQGDAGQQRTEEFLVGIDDVPRAALDVVEDRRGRDHPAIEGERVEERLQRAAR